MDALLILVNASGGDVKVSVSECARVIIDQVGARAGAPVLAEEQSRIVTTKGQVDDDVVVLEFLVDLAFPAGEKSSWGTLQRRSR